MKNEEQNFSVNMKIVFLHDKKLQNVKWEVLPHPPFSSDMSIIYFCH